MPFDESPVVPSDAHPPLGRCPFRSCNGNGVMRYSERFDDYAVSCDREPGHWPTHCSATPVEAAAAWNARNVDPATLALARLGAWLVSKRLLGAVYPPVPDDVRTPAQFTPGVRERIAELLGEEAT